MTQDEEAARVAASLTKAQRGALLSLPRIGGNNPGREYTALLDLGLADCTIRQHENGWDGNGWWVRPLDLGLRVKAILANQGDAS